MKYIAIAMVLACLVPPVQAQTEPNDARDARLIGEAQNASVHAIDETLSDIAFKKWLQDESGPDSKYRWEVNDCGEQTGTPGETGPIPLCVEVDVSLKDGREIVIFILNDRPPAAKTPDWKIFFAQLTTPHEKISLRRLSDLPAALAKTR